MTTISEWLAAIEMKHSSGSLRVRHVSSTKGDNDHRLTCIWVPFGLDPSLRDLEAGVTPSGGRHAKNSAGDAVCKGPCPRGGDAHHYRFTVYALGEGIAAGDGADTGDVRRRIREAVIAKGTLTGTFDR